MNELCTLELPAECLKEVHDVWILFEVLELIGLPKAVTDAAHRYYVECGVIAS